MQRYSVFRRFPNI